MGTNVVIFILYKKLKEFKNKKDASYYSVMCDITKYVKKQDIR